MAIELEFSDVIDFLADHQGRKVYVEIGTRDRDSTERTADAFILKLHGCRLGKVVDATDHDLGLGRKAVMVWLEREDASPPAVGEDPPGGTRLFLNPAQVTAIQGDPQRMLTVWLDDAVYIGLSGP